MKLKLLITGLLLTCSTAIIHAQQVQDFALTAQTQAGVYKATPDTLTNTDTTYLRVAPSGSWTTFREYGDVTYNWSVVPSISGTTTGTVVIQGSNSGTFYRYGKGGDWVTLTSSTAEYNGSSSISITGSSTIYGYFILPNNQFKYIRLVYLAATTQTSVVTGSCNLRKHAGG